MVKKLPKNDHLLILGDFNARVVSDHDSSAPCLGHFGFRKMNSNGQSLLEFCYKQNICVTNSFLKLNCSIKYLGDTRFLKTGTN